MVRACLEFLFLKLRVHFLQYYSSESMLGDSPLSITFLSALFWIDRINRHLSSRGPFSFPAHETSEILNWRGSSVEIRVVSLIGCFSVLNFRAQITTNQRHYMDLCRATSSVWNFSGRISDVSQAGKYSQLSLQRIPSERSLESIIVRVRNSGSHFQSNLYSFRRGRAGFCL